MSIKKICDEILNKTKASKMSRAFQHYAQSEDKKIAKEEAEKHKVSRPSYLSGEIKPLEGGAIRVRPKASEESMSLSINDICDDILSKYMGTGRYSGAGANEPVVTRREGYIVRERPLPGQTQASIKAGHVAEQKKEAPKKMKPEEKEKTKIREEGYRLGQKRPESFYAPPAPPEKKYSGSWREYFRSKLNRSEDKMSLRKSVDELLNKALSGLNKPAVKKTDKIPSPEVVTHKPNPVKTEGVLKPVGKSKDYKKDVKTIEQHSYPSGGHTAVVEGKGKKANISTVSLYDPKEQEVHVQHGKGKTKTIPTTAEHEKELKEASIKESDMKKNHSYVYSGETEDGLKKKKKQAPKADGHTLGKDPTIRAEGEMEPMSLSKSVDALLEKAKSRSAMGQYDESVVKKLKKQPGVKEPYALAAAIKQGTVQHKSIDDLTIEQHLSKSHPDLIKDLKFHEKPGGHRKTEEGFEHTYQETGGRGRLASTVTTKTKPGEKQEQKRYSYDPKKQEVEVKETSKPYVKKVIEATPEAEKELKEASIDVRTCDLIKSYEDQELEKGGEMAARAVAGAIKDPKLSPKKYEKATRVSERAAEKYPGYPEKLKERMYRSITWKIGDGIIKGGRVLPIGPGGEIQNLVKDDDGGEATGRKRMDAMDVKKEQSKSRKEYEGEED
jgi:hypothetical protein